MLYSSHVDVLFQQPFYHSNTSHVIIHPFAKRIQKILHIFKYISCYYSSAATNSTRLRPEKFKYI